MIAALVILVVMSVLVLALGIGFAHMDRHLPTDRDDDCRSDPSEAIVIDSTAEK